MDKVNTFYYKGYIHRIRTFFTDAVAQVESRTIKSSYQLTRMRFKAEVDSFHDPYSSAMFSIMSPNKAIGKYVREKNLSLY